MSSQYLTQIIYEAYRKLKNYYYYDNSSLFTRMRISKFEDDIYNLDKNKFKKRFQEKTKELLSFLENPIDDNELTKFLEKRIDFVILPKGMDANNNKNANPGIKYISNSKRTDKYEVDKYNLMIDASIDIHILSTLWVMFVGVHLSKLIKPHNYAYQFSLCHSEKDNKNYVPSGLQLFKPYYKGYQDWRDNALKKADEILNEKRNATIISLDIKRYFYNVRMQVASTIENLLNNDKIAIPKEYKDLAIRLSQILDKIHETYFHKVKEYLPEDEAVENIDGYMLPVGLVSSGVLGNLYLNDFDELIVNNLHPEYYGRYVDDMLFVIGETDIADNPSEFLNERFVKKGILELYEENKEYHICGKSNLCIQTEKVVVEHFVHYESHAALAKFRDNIRKQRSEFRFLPDEDVVEKDFDEAAFAIQYSGSVNKIRDIKDFTEDKYGASTFLAHKIFLACYDTDDNKSELNKTSKQIMTFFNGNASLEFYSLWEKVFTYFVIKEDVKAMNTFKNKLSEAIEKCSVEGISETNDRLKKSLNALLNYSIAMPLSMHYDFLLPEDDFEKEVLKSAQLFRHSNMFRHQFLGLGGLNLAKDLLLNEKVNLFKQEIPKDFTFKIEKDAIILLLPHHAHFDDICMMKMFHYTYNYSSKDNQSINESLSKVPEECYEEYVKVNYGWHNLFCDESKKHNQQFVKGFLLEHNGLKDTLVYAFKVTDDKESYHCHPNKKIAIANLIVDKTVIEQTAIEKINLKLERRNDLFRIINEAIRNRCEMLILPELSVPYQWLDLLVAMSKKHNLAIVTGLTYIVGKKRHAFNVVVTLLPIKTKNYNTCVIFPRVKNHYAPKETEWLKSYGFRIPKQHKGKCVYHLYHWRKSYFSVYNCFELASIEDRALMKSKVDFVIATELNADINYYSDIAGSWVRDIHSYFIQVNSSEYGDSRIIKPAKTEEKDLVRIKGGKNTTALVEVLDIESLRNFQLPDYAVQESMKGFKLTPPEFNKDDVKIRIHDEDFK